MSAPGSSLQRASASQRSQMRVPDGWTERRHAGLPGGSMGMPGDPVPRDVDAAAYPDPVVALDVIEEPLEPGETAGPAQQPAMHADRQHLRPLGAFGVEHVEGIAQIREELLAAC